MAQYVTTPSSGRPVDVPGIHIANPLPLGLNAFAFATATLGCAFAGFIIPFGFPSLSAVATTMVLFFGGIVQLIAGMWEFRRNHTVEATLFSSYGGFLLALGAGFLPAFGIFTAATERMANQVMGLFFLCWTIFSIVLIVGSLRTNAAYLTTLVLMCLAFFFLLIGALVGGNRVLLGIGGWLAIICALVAWYTALSSLVSTTHTLEESKVPVGHLAHGESMG